LPSPIPTDRLTVVPDAAEIPQPGNYSKQIPDDRKDNLSGRTGCIAIRQAELSLPLHALPAEAVFHPGHSFIPEEKNLFAGHHGPLLSSVVDHFVLE
jgi:hypothetical protein